MHFYHTHEECTFVSYVREVHRGDFVEYAQRNTRWKFPQGAERFPIQLTLHNIPTAVQRIDLMSYIQCRDYHFHLLLVALVAMLELLPLLVLLSNILFSLTLESFVVSSSPPIRFYPVIVLGHCPVPSLSRRKADEHVGSTCGLDTDHRTKIPLEVIGEDAFG
jgi:hypothetical protein